MSRLLKPHAMCRRSSVLKLHPMQKRKLNSLSEGERIATLHHYEILDTPPDGAFDRVTALAARFFNVPISLVSLVDQDRIWFKSRFGLDVHQIDRKPGLCASAIFSESAYVVKNAVEDPRTLANPLVAESFGLKFYAAIPLVTHDGHGLGTFNIIDFKPRDFTPQEEEDLKAFADMVMDHIELRLSARLALSSLSNLLKKEHAIGDYLTICAWTRKICVEGNWMSFEEFLVERLGIAITHGIHPDTAKTIIANVQKSRKPAE